jgi:hypothetical protein
MFFEATGQIMIRIIITSGKIIDKAINIAIPIILLLRAKYPRAKHRATKYSVACCGVFYFYFK